MCGPLKTKFMYDMYDNQENIVGSVSVRGPVLTNPETGSRSFGLGCTVRVDFSTAKTRAGIDAIVTADGKSLKFDRTLRFRDMAHPAAVNVRGVGFQTPVAGGVSINWKRVLQTIEGRKAGADAIGLTVKSEEQRPLETVDTSTFDCVIYAVVNENCEGMNGVARWSQPVVEALVDGVLHEGELFPPGSSVLGRYMKANQTVASLSPTAIMLPCKSFKTAHPMATWVLLESAEPAHFSAVFLVDIDAAPKCDRKVFGQWQLYGDFYMGRDASVPDASPCC